ncbi:triose-phosphate transporter family-domain-containing protein [Kockovaella imperatae]|uniref:Triose-phosphate transporter family-domain-containing protein n=1 Tax=Kockovaella imperatae TaxID=4999 RepID=A0A1Y1UNY7_9TREE|nr:triose-phosphate transporter family-domain-containing protein [Kockovaella imperatae]ORX39760.1 triose-phosphate transporter family-domain-containing protein [Kockovaella imperatae]
MPASPPLLPSHSRDSSPLPSPGLSPSPITSSRRSPLLSRKSGSPMEDKFGAAENGYINEKDGGLEAATKNIEITPNLPDERESAKKGRLGAATIIPIWIALSSAVILYNKYLYINLDYPYPVFITSYHLGCAAIGTRILRATTHLMDGLDHITMTKDLYFRSIVPIGILFSGSLIFSNTAYLTLSVSFIQMLKAFTPVAILLISAIFKIQTLNSRLVVIVLLISTGCALAAAGEVHFEMFGFMCQATAVLFEASRLVMIQILLQGFKMDPLCSLHYYAPVCSLINACFIPFTEGMAPLKEAIRIGPLIMLTNAGVAFGLNVAAVFLISAAGGLVLTLAGVFKDILLISASVIFFGSSITPMQIFGYSLALGGLFAYKSASGKK